MARSHSTSVQRRSAATSAAVGRKVERIKNAGSVYTARDVALRSMVRSSKTRRQAAGYGYYPIFRRSSPPLNVAGRVTPLTAATRRPPRDVALRSALCVCAISHAEIYCPNVSPLRRVSICAIVRSRRELRHVVDFERLRGASLPSCTHLDRCPRGRDVAHLLR
jgi:hypothetical protein